MMKSKILLFVMLFLSVPLFAKNVTNGVLNFEFAREDKKIIRLNGDWEFYKGQTFSSLSNYQLKIDFIQVPGSWTGGPMDSKVPSYGCNTYRVFIGGLRPHDEYGIFSRQSPATATRIFANGKFVAGYGEFSRHEESYVPLQYPMFCTFFSDDKGSIELVIQVANFDQLSGGILTPIMFGLAKDVSTLYYYTMIILAVIVGMIISVFFANFLIWIFDKTHAQGLYFAIFLWVLLSRITIGDINILGVIIAPVPYNLQVRLSNLILLSFGFFSLVYRLDNFFTIKYPRIDKTISYVALTFGILLMCLPVKLISYIAPILVILSMLFFIYSIYRLTLALKVRNYYVVIYTCFYFIIFSGIILDFFFDGPRYDMMLNYTEIATIILICIVVVYLALYLEFLVRDYLNQKNTLSERYVAYRKFVPNDLSHILGKESFGKIKLGDYAEIEATIMVIGSRVVPPEKTQISLREQFETMGFYSAKIVEVIENSGGMVLSIVGNEITALFRKNTQSAIDAAGEINRLLRVMNARREQDYYPSASFSIGVHYGSVLLGVIGSQNRIDYTIISPNVELTDNICTLGFNKHIPVIISELATNNLDEVEVQKLKPLGRIKFREITHPINLYGLSSMQNGDDDPDVLDIPRVITQRDADRYIDL